MFIVGGPRSGTSVLARAMRLVFDLPGHGESHVMPAMARVAHHLRQYRERMETMPGDLLAKQLPFQKLEQVVFDFARSFYCQSYGGDSWVDKTPSDEAVHGITLIAAIFPDARIIITRRNGIEVVQSTRAKFNLSFADACHNWASVMAGIELSRRRCPEALWVDQYDFTNDTHRLAETIARHLGEPAKAGRLAAFLRSDRQDQSSSHDWNRRTTLDDMDWTEPEKAHFRAICGPWMMNFGFPMEMSDLATSSSGSEAAC